MIGKKRKVRRFGWLFLLGLALLVIVGCSSSGSGGSSSPANTPQENGTEEQPSANGEVITLQLGHSSIPDLPFDIGAKAFKEEVEKASEGRIIIEIYDSGQLGTERDMIEQVQYGTLDLYSASAAPLINFVPEIGVIDMPFIFTSYDEVWTALDGEVGAMLAEKIEEAGFKLLGFWDEGFKNITNSQKEIRTVEDLKGLKIRTQENQVMVDTYKALGADPTPMAWGEIYTAIQQGVIDGYEGSYTPIVDGKLYEVQKYLTEARVNYAGAVHLMNKDKFESLDPDLQQIIVQAAEHAAQIQRKASEEQMDEFKQVVIDNGLEIIEFEELDLAPFREMVQPIYEQYGPQYSELIEKIEALRQ